MPSLSKRGEAIDHLGRIEKVAPHGSNHTSAQKIPRGPNKVNYNSNWQVFHYLALKIATNLLVDMQTMRSLVQGKHHTLAVNWQTMSQYSYC
jgi:hypothetical protein